ncbi:MAG: glycolate oxidase subunit GlcE [Rhodospirillales bacterium]
MPNTFRPETERQLCDAIMWALEGQLAFSVQGGGSKRAFGRPVELAYTLDLTGFSGITLYQPEELVITAKAATPLVEIEAALAEKNQHLAFEPATLAPVYGGEGSGAMTGTVGGALACNLSGPRRITAGAARDHLLGFHAVSGRGEAFKSGGRVVKNVTGFDLSKLMAGSFGTLAVMTDVSLKVLPAPEKTRTVLISGADDRRAVEAMTAALCSPYEISAAAHMPKAAATRSAVTYVSGAGQAVTAVRIEGIAPSVAARCESVKKLLQPFGTIEELHSANSVALWREIRDVAFFAGADRGGQQIWRLSVPPSEGAGVVHRVTRDLDGEAYYDWGGGLIWLAIAPREDAGAGIVRGAVSASGGHATLLRADDAVRSRVPVFQPQPAPLAALTKRVKQAFDPKGALNPGRMILGV